MSWYWLLDICFVILQRKFETWLEVKLLNWPFYLTRFIILATRKGPREFTATWSNRNSGRKERRGINYFYVFVVVVFKPEVQPVLKTTCLENLPA